MAFIAVTDLLLTEEWAMAIPQKSPVFRLESYSDLKAAVRLLNRIPGC